MTTPPVLPAPLASACADGHPLELWVLVDGEVVQCPGAFMHTDTNGRPQLTATVPEDFVGVIRTGSAVRGFFADGDGSIHTFLTSVSRWTPFDDDPRSARIVLDSPVIVAPCQRRRGRRRNAQGLRATLSVSIRGHKESVTGRLVDASPNGVAVRLVRTAGNWFGTGTRLQVEIDLPGADAPATFAAVVSRVTTESLHYLYGLKCHDPQVGRAVLRDVLDHLV